MPIVLIVDDSEVDRRLVGGLLPKDLEWLIEFADNGVEALEKMRLALPDVVITDMLMPQMDGMELVSNIRLDYPHIPVILITGHGNETLAVEALGKGATSYVPKQLLAEKLQETVEQVLAVAKADRSYSRLISCLQSTQYAFALDNDPALIPPLVDLLQQILAGMRCCDATGRMHAGIAVEEALLNAVFAGNLEMDREQVLEARSQLRQGRVSQLVKTRCAQSPYAERVTHVQATISLDQAVFVIRDEGRGFDTTRVPDRHDPETLEQLEGRGLVLIKNFMDEVHFNGSGNEVTMVMRCSRGSQHPTNRLEPQRLLTDEQTDFTHRIRCLSHLPPRGLHCGGTCGTACLQPVSHCYCSPAHGPESHKLGSRDTDCRSCSDRRRCPGRLLAGQLTREDERIVLQGGSCLLLSEYRFGDCVLELDYQAQGSHPAAPVLYLRAEQRQRNGDDRWSLHTDRSGRAAARTWVAWLASSGVRGRFVETREDRRARRVGQHLRGRATGRNRSMPGRS